MSEHLSFGGPDSPAPAPGGTPPKRRGRWVLAGAAGVVGLGVVGGGVWAAMSFFGTGAQPAEALPASTLAYLALDLDPNGSQKIEALRALNKFPAFRDAVGLDADDDVRERLVELIADDIECTIDFAADVEPWLGSRFAMAGVMVEDAPQPVVVAQVEDADAAEAGLARVAEACGEDFGEFTVSGDWVVIGESTDITDQVVADAVDSSLAGDADFTEWTGEVGGSGVATAYLSADSMRIFFEEIGGVGVATPGVALEPAVHTDEELPEVGGEVVDPFAACPGLASGQPDAAALDAFRGAAASLRFDDGDLTVDFAGDGSMARVADGELDASDVVGALPADSALALGFASASNWVDVYVEQMKRVCGPEFDEDRFFAGLSQMSGLDLPDDLQTLLGDSLALVLGPGFDVDDESLPVAARVHGDGAAIQAVMDKLAQRAPDLAGFLGTTVDGDVAVLGPDAAYREEVAKDGGLGETDGFRDVVPDPEGAHAILYLAPDQLSGLLEMMGDPEFTANVEPLAGIGASAELDGDVVRGQLRVATDD